MRLSPRLEALFNRCQPGLPLWDLCCDHGYLGLHALHSGAFTEVLFNDTAPHLLALVKAKLRGGERARLISGKAEEIIEPLTGNIVIAGVGAEKIFKILDSHLRRGTLIGPHVLVCPETDTDWLVDQSLKGLELIEKVSIPHNHGLRWILRYAVTLNHTPDSVH